jgi:hypothetical protein
VLTEEARSRFPDIGTRAGTVLAVDGWLLVAFDKLDWQTRLPASDLERIEK